MPEVKYGFREDLYDVTLTIEAANQTFVIPIDKQSGLDVTAKSTKYRPVNGLEEELELGGTRSVSEATLTALWSTDVEEALNVLVNFPGRANVSIKKQALDENGFAFGKVRTYVGKLTGFTDPPTDSQSEKAAVAEFKCSVKSNISIQ